MWLGESVQGVVCQGGMPWRGELRQPGVLHRLRRGVRRARLLRSSSGLQRGVLLGLLGHGDLPRVLREQVWAHRRLRHLLVSCGREGYFLTHSWGKSRYDPLETGKALPSLPQTGS